jgi:pyruvate, water dikinase
MDASAADASGSQVSDTPTDGGNDISTEAGAARDAQVELVCGSYNRVNPEDRAQESTEFTRKRDFEAEAAKQWACVSGGGADAGADAGAALESLSELGCEEDFEKLASHTAAGVSVKVLIDRAAPLVDDEYPLYFINSNLFGIHYDFASARLSVGANGELPVVGSLAEFNSTEYTSPSRRFLLGALTYYPGTDRWVYELAQNDNATAAMITEAFDLVAKHSWIGSELAFHTTSEQIAATAQELPEDIEALPTSEVIGGGDYQPLNLAESYGRLRFVTAEALTDQTQYVDFRDIVVLDYVPNDISVTVGIITSEFQTPLAHINVLSQNRGTPNMALVGAYDDPDLRALEGEWVRLEVRQESYDLDVVSDVEADAWWEEHRPSVVQVPEVDKETSELADIEDLVDLETDSVYDAVKKATVTFGGKAAHYAVLRHVDGLPVAKAFAVPVRYYFEFMEQHGFDEQVEEMLADSEFQDSPEVRDVRLEELRDAMHEAEVDPEFMATLREKLAEEYPGERMRFRSSTNAEDLDGFTGAGLYTSKSGDESPDRAPEDAERTFDAAIRKVWASVWYFRAFEERRYRGIDHEDVGMGLLVHRSFPDEEANGVALTNNPFDKSGAYPAFYVNVQLGEESVVMPPAGQTTDSYLHHWDTEGQRAQFFSYSSLVPSDRTVLTTREMHELGEALARIRTFFAPAYAKGTEWWAMDVEFKFEGEPGECPELFVKQARPFGNR